LVQDCGNDLSARRAFKVELRIDNRDKESAFGARQDLEGGLPGYLRFEMIALEREIDDCTGIEPIFADVIAEQRNCGVIPGLGPVAGLILGHPLGPPSAVSLEGWPHGLRQGGANFSKRMRRIAVSVFN
jgi:hypothetical protein